MKIAFLITGHLRTIDKCYESFFKNVYIDNSDIYIHTWDSTDSKIKVWHKHKFKKKFNIEEKIKKIYKPKDYIIEKQDLTINTRLKKKEINVSNISHYYSFYSLIKCYELLKKSNIEYDLIIKIRPDLFFKEKLPININSKKLNIACNRVEWDKSIGNDWTRMKATDVIYYGKMEIFEKLYQFKNEFFLKIENNDKYIFQFTFNKLFDVNVLEYYYKKHWVIKR
tara:strand:- start:29 stop:700 length:672 start_codon:yes stop_codon:yes gene_type:complete